MTVANTFRDDISVDFGRMERRIPLFGLRPRSVAELQNSLQFLREAAIPWKLRGCGHTASGEVLIARGAVVDMRAVSGVVADDPDREEITVLAGTTWLELWQYLAKSGRRPMVLTDNPRVTVGGTLSVGGLGDTSHLYGPQVANVRQLTICGADGQMYRSLRGELLFDHALASHGQLGAIVEATMPTLRLGARVVSRVAFWKNVRQWARDVEALQSELNFDYLRARVSWRTSNRVWAMVGKHTSDSPNSIEEFWSILRPAATGKVEEFDMLAIAQTDPAPNWSFFGPCAEVVLPYPDGIESMEEILELAELRGLTPYLPRGASIMLFPGTRGLPLSPFPFEKCLVVAFRPEPHEREAAITCQQIVREICETALESGGRVYLASIALHGTALDGLVAETSLQWLFAPLLRTMDGGVGAPLVRMQN